MSRLTMTRDYRDILAPLVAMSLGLGTQLVPLTLTAVQGAAPAETGLASALLNTMQQRGGALGLSALATVAIDAATTKARTGRSNTYWALWMSSMAAAKPEPSVYHRQSQQHVRNRRPE